MKPVDPKPGYIQEKRVIEGVPVLIAGPENARAQLVFFHGAGGSKERTLELAGPLHALGFLTWHPDALHHGERGQGEDVFKNRRLIVEAQAQTIEEAPRLIAAMRAVFPGLKVGALGASMGGYVVHELLCQGAPLFAAAALMSAGRPPAWLSRQLPEGFVPALDRGGAYGKAPLLHVHGEADPIVPLSDAAATIEALKPRFAPGRLALAVLPGVGHVPRPEMIFLATGWFLRWL